jgi:hypothetical protein
MRNNPNTPVMTADGKTAVYDSHSWNRKQERPEAFVRRTMDLMNRHTVTIFASASPIDPPCEWEFAYLSQGRHAGALGTYEEWAAKRAAQAGYYYLSVNFEDLSHCVRIITRDKGLAEAWQNLIDHNPGGASAREWHDRVTAEHAIKRASFEKRQRERAREHHA